MKRNGWYALLGIVLWSTIYLSFAVEVLSGSAFTSSFPQTLFVQLFLFFIPGLIIALLLYEIGNIKNAKERTQSFWNVLVLLLLFLIFYRWIY